jgi:hypothetical protein
MAAARELFNALPHAVDRGTCKRDPATTTSASSASSFPYLLKGSTIPPSVGTPSFAWHESETWYVSLSFLSWPLFYINTEKSQALSGVYEPIRSGVALFSWLFSIFHCGICTPGRGCPCLGSDACCKIFNTQALIS